MHVLLFYVALLATRVPLARLIVDEIVDRLGRDRLRDTLRRERWDEVLREMKDMGHDVTRMGYEQFKASLPNVRLVGSQHFHIRMMIEGAFDLLPHLARRVWSIAISPSGNFIGSDRPVAVTFATPHRGKVILVSVCQIRRSLFR
jgi:hypothetical protein